MHYDIEFDPSYSLLTVRLDAGETVLAEPGAMVAQQDAELSTGMARGGLTGGIRRLLAGESFVVNRFTGRDGGGGWVMLAPPSPGDIIAREVRPGEEFFVQSGAFLASSEGLQLDSSFQGFRALFSGEGFFFLRARARDFPETLFFDSYGAVREIPVRPGGEVVVDNGHLVAFTDGVDYSVGRVGGIRSMLAGGEGLVIKLRGSGSVWVQTRSLESLAGRISAFLPGRAGGSPAE